ncbi:hypothetical protein CLUG_00843 [Clavispora lusitaniae ATCC 42720]|uniref:Uncharacterized protein n=1 Tax=Clavispora lusitaniae (strain ATCC 42720) TaxID=306902 RepID=C4XY20_CLAL4|nr:uncharacterized protein CLUG_00843 [Clavispora lusitaniae ATCC 42720]EEQ36720.1 hypothetical protein CLUG_00843 [Clavispora lusitaniae ATCC 42720]
MWATAPCRNRASGILSSRSLSGTSSVAAPRPYSSPSCGRFSGRWPPHCAKRKHYNLQIRRALPLMYFATCCCKVCLPTWSASCLSCTTCSRHIKRARPWVHSRTLCILLRTCRLRRNRTQKTPPIRRAHMRQIWATTWTCSMPWRLFLRACMH